MYGALSPWEDYNGGLVFRRWPSLCSWNPREVLHVSAGYHKLTIVLVVGYGQCTLSTCGRRIFALPIRSKLSSENMV